MKKYNGIVEGFFSNPFPMWCWKDRYSVFNEIKTYKNFNTYLYCPKDDKYVTDKWDIPYLDDDVRMFKSFINDCRQNGVEFIYGVNPELNQPEMNTNEFDTYIEKILVKLKQFKKIGVNTFCILYDDISFAYNALQGLDSPEAAQFANIQSRIVNAIKQRLENSELIFCSSEYFFKEDNSYIKTLREKLSKDISLIWTGDEVFTKKVTNEMFRKAKRLAGNRDLIWWNNYPVNDPMSEGILNLGGFNEPEIEVTENINGILINPMREAYLSIPNLITFFDYFNKPKEYDAENTYLNILKETFNISDKASQAIIECSNYSPIDSNFKFFYGKFTELGTKGIKRSLDDALVNWDVDNKFLSMLEGVKSDIVYLNKCIGNTKMDIEDFKRFDIFPVPIDPVYLDRILSIILARICIYSEKNLIKSVLQSIQNKQEIDIRALSGEIQALAGIYNKYRNVNKKNLTPQEKGMIEESIKSVIERERFVFLNVLEYIEFEESFKLVLLRKNINQYSLRKL